MILHDLSIRERTFTYTRQCGCEIIPDRTLSSFLGLYACAHTLITYYASFEFELTSMQRHVTEIFSANSYQMELAGAVRNEVPLQSRKY